MSSQPVPGPSYLAAAPSDALDEANMKRLSAAWLRWQIAHVAKLAVRRPFAILAVGILSLLANAGLSLLAGVPKPHVHDEFSYLLAADTFAHGRLSNPTHPLWVHFESMHVLQEPTYASKYPPGQGLMLAAGKWVGGHFIVGSWLAAALASAATCWMLQGWVRPRWALVGGYLIALHPTVLAWGQSYWGGSLALLGGSLVLGGVARAAACARWRTGAAIGVGMSILAITRPYEGMAISALSMVALFLWLVRRGGPATLLAAASAIAPPIAVTLAITAAGLAFYNTRVTGSPVRLPYTVYERQYSDVPLFLIQRMTDHDLRFNNPEMRRFNEKYRSDYIQKKSMGTPKMLVWSGRQVVEIYFPLVDALISERVGGATQAQAQALLLYYLPLILIQLPLLVVPGVLFGRTARPALLLLGGFTVALLLTTWIQPHYAAPAFGLVLVLTLRSLRWLLGWRPIGRGVGLVALVLYGVWPLLVFVVGPLSQGEPGFGERRERIASQLRDDGAWHLIVVRYGPDHNVLNEWVYNEADIDGANVVWARELGPDRNRMLLEYFRGRRIWLLEADAPDPSPVPYPGTGDERLP
jgi:hypothetical protein